MDRRGTSLPPLAVAVIISFNLILSTTLAIHHDSLEVFARSTAEPDQAPSGTWSRWAEQPTDLDLRDVYLYAQDAGWAVGGADVQSLEGDVPVILRYAGGRWSVADGLPDAMQVNVRLTAVDGTGPDNVWVAGQEYQRELSDQRVGTLLHYDGDTWRKVPLPDVPLVAPLSDIEVVPTEAGYEVWAISLANARDTSYVLHFNGTAWDAETIQNRSLLGIHMLNADEGQMVTKGAGGAPDGHHYWYHNGFWRDTSVWTPQPLNAVSMAEPTYGWAVGGRGATDEYVGQCHTSTIDCKWNARQAVRSPAGAPVNTDLWDVQMVSLHEGWLVGEPWNRHSTVAYLIQESSPKWRLIPVEDDPGKILYGLAMWAGSDGHAVEGWAVGANGTILHYTVPGTAPSLTPTATATPTPTETATPRPEPTRTATPTSSLTPGTTATVLPTLSPTASPPRLRIFLPLALRESHAGGRPNSQPQEP